MSPVPRKCLRVEQVGFLAFKILSPQPTKEDGSIATWGKVQIFSSLDTRLAENGNAAHLEIWKREVCQSPASFLVVLEMGVFSEKEPCRILELDPYNPQYYPRTPTPKTLNRRKQDP